MTPIHFKSIIRDIEKYAEGRPVCAFMMRNGHIFTGTWLPLTGSCNVLVVSLSDKEAPPVYLSVHAIDAVAVSSNGLPMGEWPR